MWQSGRTYLGEEDDIKINPKCVVKVWIGFRWVGWRIVVSI
jgi:hypothetical protein